MTTDSSKATARALGDLLGVTEHAYQELGWYTGDSPHIKRARDVFANLQEAASSEPKATNTDRNAALDAMKEALEMFQSYCRTQRHVDLLIAQGTENLEERMKAEMRAEQMEHRLTTIDAALRLASGEEQQDHV